MIGFRQDAVRRPRLPVRVSGTAAAIGLMLVAACGASPSSHAGPASSPPAGASPAATPPAGSTAECDSAATCYTPQQLQVAYGVKPLLDRGIDGKGETVVLPELAESRLNPPLVTDLRQDMAAFDSMFHLPAARMRVDVTLSGAGSPWLAWAEEVLDAEVVHALAPGATLVILLLPSTSLDNTKNAVAAAVAALGRGSTEGGSVISVSAAAQIGGEQCVSRAQASSVNVALEAVASRHVTVVAASGDMGAAAYPCDVYAALTGAASTYTPVKGTGLLASDPLVLSAGGTTLTASHATGTWQGETAWGLPYTNDLGSGGGFSRLFPRPGYQDGVPGIAAARGVPDVSADANAHTAMAMVLNGGGRTTIRDGGGTSAAAPAWAAVIALADQYAGRHLGFVNPAVYQIARGPSYHQAFHDITTGNNTANFPSATITGYQAAPGWDPVTGWGSPDAQALVPLLARYATP